MQQQQEPTATVERNFGEAVNIFRGFRGYSQREFARRLTERGMSVDASAISRIESGARAIRLSEAMTIAEVLNVDLDMLVEGSKTPSQQFRTLRRIADNSMNALDDTAKEFIEAFMDSNRFLQEHPDLLPELEDPDFGVPATTGDYLEWIGQRMDRNAAKWRDHVVTADQVEADALIRLAARFISGMASPKPSLQKTHDNESEGSPDGEHSEEA